MALALATLAGTSAFPGDAAIRSDSSQGTALNNRLFFFGGVDIAHDSYFAWNGFVGAPLGLLHEDGPRFRIAGAMGRYSYRAEAVPGRMNDGYIASGEIMVGFQRVLGPVTITALLGLHAENQRLSAPDPHNPAQGTAVGIKAAIESYTRLSPEWFAATNAAASTVHRSYHARAAIGREHASGIAFGLEGQVHGNARYVEPRVGAFVHATHRRSIVALAGGYLSNSDKGGGAYATVSIYAPY